MSQSTWKHHIGIIYDLRLNFLFVYIHLSADNDNSLISIRCLCWRAGAMRFPPNLSSGRVLTLATLLVSSMTVRAMARQSSHPAGGLPSVTGVTMGQQVEGESYSGQKCSDAPQRGSDPSDSSAASAFHLPRAKVIRCQYRLTRRSVQRFVRPGGDAVLPTGAFLATSPFRTGSRFLAVLPFSALQNCISLQRFLL